MAAQPNSQKTEELQHKKRYQPIYEAIDNGNLQNAIKLCERKEIVHTPLAKALRAYCLSRLGVIEEACSTARDIIRKTITDPLVLNPLASVLKADPASLTQMYEAACAAEPGNEKLARQLCFAYLRVQDYGKLKTACMRLYKASGSPTYLFWAALAMHCAAGGAPASVSAAGAQHAPCPATGGGAGFGCAAVTADPAAASSLQLAATMLERGLDKMTPEERDSEQLGMWAHTLVRLGRASEAAAAFVDGGKYSYESTGSAAAAAPAAPVPSSPAPEASSSDAEVAPAAAGNGAENGIIEADRSKAGLGRRERKPSQLLLGAPDEDEEEPGAGIPVEERSPEEDVLESPDGRSGRGRSPGPFQPVDRLRLVAFLLTEAALATDALGDSKSALDGWTSARAAYASLLTKIEAEDWATHQGLAYCEARMAAAQLADAAASDKAAAAKLLGPLSADDITGVHALDSLLAAQLSAGLKRAATAEGASANAAPRDGFSRGQSLSLIQLLAVRLELAHRLDTAVDIPVSTLEVCRKAAAAASVQYVALLIAYIRAVGHKGCCFHDLLPFLLPLFPPLPATLEPEAGGASLKAKLTGFLSKEAHLLSIPLAPTTTPGSASDMAHATHPLRWSFTISGGQAAPLIAFLQALRENNRPTDSMKDELEALIKSARTAALARDAASASASAPPGGEPVSAAAGKNAPAPLANPLPGLPPVDNDPHTVRSAMAPALDLALSKADEESLSAIRSRIRRYTTAMQLLRYLGRLGFGCGYGGYGTSAGSADDPAAVARSAADELTAAWQRSLLLAVATQGGQREAQEFDDLILLAAHCLWDVGTAASVDATRARHAVLESLFLLECGAGVSPSNNQLRLAAVRAYGWMAAPSAALQHWGPMSIKYIQWDTLSHVLLPTVSRCCMVDAARRLVEEIHHYHETSARDHAEHIKMAVRCGNYGAALDMIRMRERLTHSATLVTARSTYGMVGMSYLCRTLKDAFNHVRKCILTGEEPRMHVDASVEAQARLRDNDDRDTAAAWGPPPLPLVAELRHGPPPELAAPGSRRSKRGDTTDFASAALKHAARIVAASAPSSSSSSLSAGAAIQSVLARYATAAGLGCNAWERTLRRALREGVITTRHAAQGVILWSQDSSKASTALATQRLEEGLAEAGLLDGPAPSDAGAGGESESLRTLLFGDVTTGTLVVVDTGVSTERASIRRGCAALLSSCLRATEAAIEAAPDTESSDAAAQPLPSHVHISDARAGKLVAEAEPAWGRAAEALARVTAVAPELMAAVAANFYDTSSSQAAPTAAAAAAAATATGAGGGKKGKAARAAGPVQALQPASVAETALVVQHVGVYVQLALGTVARAVARGGKLAQQAAAAATASSAAASSGKSGKGAGAGAGKGGGSKASAAQATAAVAPHYTAAADAFKTAHAAVLKGLGAISAALTSLGNALDAPNAEAEQLVLAGFEPAGCATAFVAEHLTARAAKLAAAAASSSAEGPKKEKEKKERSKDGAPASNAADPPAAGGDGASFLADKLAAREKTLRERADVVPQLLAASYTFSTARLKAELQERRVFLEGAGLKV